MFSVLALSCWQVVIRVCLLRAQRARSSIVSCSGSAHRSGCSHLFPHQPFREGFHSFRYAFISERVSGPHVHLGCSRNTPSRSNSPPSGQTWRTAWRRVRERVAAKLLRAAVLALLERLILVDISGRLSRNFHLPVSILTSSKGVCRTDATA